MNYEQWVVSADGRSASHACGWSIRIEGNPANPSEVCPGVVPQGLDVLEQARLLRHGLNAIAAAAKTHPQCNNVASVQHSAASLAAKKRPSNMRVTLAANVSLNYH